jgi:hypothetical protein
VYHLSEYDARRSHLKRAAPTCTASTLRHGIVPRIETAAYGGGSACRLSMQAQPRSPWATLRRISRGSNRTSLDSRGSTGQSAIVLRRSEAFRLFLIRE